MPKISNNIYTRHAKELVLELGLEKGLEEEGGTYKLIPSKY